MFLWFTTRRLSTQRLQLSVRNGASKWTFPASPFRIYLHSTEIHEGKCGNSTTCTSTHPWCFLCLTICERMAYTFYSLFHTHFLTLTIAHSLVHATTGLLSCGLGCQDDLILMLLRETKEQNLILKFTAESLVISLLVLRARYGIWLCQFLIITYLFTFYDIVQ